MLIENMPIVLEVLDNARSKIYEMTGVNVKVCIETFPENNTDKMLALIANLVSIAFSVSIQDMKSNSRIRTNGLVDGRHAFMYIANKIMGFSSPEIGRYMGRHHASVLHGVRKIKSFIEIKDPVILKINQVIIKLPPCK